MEYPYRLVKVLFTGIDQWFKKATFLLILNHFQLRSSRLSTPQMQLYWMAPNEQHVG
jgi:hypothetical protein